MKAQSKTLWYLRNLINLCVACVRIFFYGLFHPRKLSKLAFSFFSIINEFYQFSHGKLYSFYETKTYQKLKDNQVFAQSNYFNADSSVARTGEAQVLAAITAYLKPQNIFEIGTYNGFTTLHFAYNSPNNAAIYTLDLPADFSLGQNKTQLEEYSYDDYLVLQLSKENIDKRIFRAHACSKKIKELFGDSMRFDFSPYFGKMDLIYIDGSHAYSYVKSDTENALKMLSPRGVIIWHDFDYIVHRDVFKYLNHLVQSHKIYSIPNTRFAIYGADL